MPATQVKRDLDFYRALHQLDLKRPDARRALYFARGWADLARRVLAARSAQAGEPGQHAGGLELPALRAYLDHGPGFAAQSFIDATADAASMPELQLLAHLAGWYSTRFDLADPFAASYQVWVGGPGEETIRLFGPPVAEQPAPPLHLLREPPFDAWLEPHGPRPLAIIAHYDVHGLAMLALTLRQLRAGGSRQVDCTLNFEWSGDVSKLWRRTVPRAVTGDTDYAAVVMIDCSVHSRNPARTIKAVNKLEGAPGRRLVVVDHHADTAQLAPQLLHERLQLVLTDVASCALMGRASAADRQLMALGAIGDKVPEVAAVYTPAVAPALHAANEEYHRRLIHFSPTPKALKEEGRQPLEPLWEALAAGHAPTRELADEVLGKLARGAPPPLPRYAVCGSVLLIAERLTTVGRTWYALLDQLMRQSGLAYGVALRILDQRRANMLLLTDWRAVHMPPVRYFVPAEFWPRCLGHLGAVWLDVDESETFRVLEPVAAGINEFLGTPGDFAPVAAELTRGIIEAEPPQPAPDDRR